MSSLVKRIYADKSAGSEYYSGFYSSTGQLLTPPKTSFWDGNNYGRIHYQTSLDDIRFSYRRTRCAIGFDFSEYTENEIKSLYLFVSLFSRIPRTYIHFFNFSAPNDMSWSNQGGIFQINKTITNETMILIEPTYWRNRRSSFGVKYGYPDLLPNWPYTTAYGEMYTHRASLVYRPYIEIHLNPIPPGPPTNLFPDYAANPKAPITFNWLHNPNVKRADDPQDAWELIYWQGSNTPVTVTQNNAANTYTLPANTFTQYATVYFKVRTKQAENGWGAYAEAQFELGETPPDKSLLVYPLNITIAASMGATLEWKYSSRFDVTPGKFDVSYRIGGGNWVNVTSLVPSYTLPPIHDATYVEWRVRAYNLLNDAGPWSDTAIFYTVGIPPRPTITNVSNSARPVVTWSASGLIAWELEVAQRGAVLYASGVRPFMNANSHKLTDFLHDGSYVARFRIRNEYDLFSVWAERAFTVSTAKPPSAVLSVPDNPGRAIRVYAGHAGEKAYVYRSEAGGAPVVLARMTDGYFDDYSAAPGVRYEYFVRTVAADDGFSDSGRCSGILYFDDTILAPASDLSKMLILSENLNDNPKYRNELEKRRTLVRFIGREYPVAEHSAFKNRRLGYAFYVNREKLKQLEALYESSETLFIRDKLHGRAYGVISGSIVAEGTEFNGYKINFEFSVTDYADEVAI